MIANQLVATDTLEDPGGTRIEAAGGAAVRLIAVESLRREPDAEKLLRRHPAEPPQPARLASQAVIVLARGALPVLGPIAPADLDVAACGVHRRHPVEAVSSEIHHTPAPVQISSQTIEHLERVV